MTSTVFCRRLLCLVRMTTPVVQKYDGTRGGNGEVEITQLSLVTALFINGLIVHRPQNPFKLYALKFTLECGAQLVR